MVAPFFATTSFMRALLSVSLPVSISAVAAISFPALLLSSTFVPPLPASTPTRPFGFPVFSVPLPVVFMPSVISLSPVLFIPGPLSLSASVFMMIPVLPPAPVVPAISFFVSTFALSVPAAAATSSTLSPVLIPVCAAGSSPVPVPSVPPVPIPVPAFSLFPLTVTLPLQLSIEAGAVAISLTVVAPAS